MPLGTDNLNQKAVLWLKTGVNQFNQDTYGEPEEIPCRWEDRDDQVKLDSGELINATARIMVAQVIPLESILWLGKLVDLPDYPSDLHEVVLTRNTPSLDGMNYQRTIVTQRFAGTI